jgi:hypothetical protein
VEPSDWRVKAARHTREAVMLVALALGAAGLATGAVAGLQVSSPVRGSGGSESAGLGLARSPYLGVACPLSNSTRCGRVGIAVWTTRRASRVSTVLGGVTVRLQPPAQGRDYWQAFVRLDLEQLGIPQYWRGSRPTRTLNLALTIYYPARIARGALPLLLHPGWG